MPRFPSRIRSRPGEHFRLPALAAHVAVHETAHRAGVRAGIVVRASLVIALALASGCATVPEQPAVPPPAPSAPPLPRTAEPPPPPVNLSGFPLPYRQGFADGCASATGPERKDSVRFPADGNYRTGWQDGLAQCRRKR